MADENNSPTHGDPAEEGDTSAKPKVIKCPCCDSVIFRNGELKKKGARFIELEKAEDENERLGEQVQELRDRQTNRAVEADPTPSPTPEPEPAVQTQRRKPFLVAERSA